MSRRLRRRSDYYSVADLYQQTGDTSLIEKYFNEMDKAMDTVSQQGYDTGIYLPSGSAIRELPAA